MRYAHITLGWLREQTKHLPDDVVVGRVIEHEDLFCNKYNEVVPYDDGDVAGDQYLFQVEPETGILALGYNF